MKQKLKAGLTTIFFVCNCCAFVVALLGLWILLASISLSDNLGALEGTLPLTKITFSYTYERFFLFYMGDLLILILIRNMAESIGIYGSDIPVYIRNLLWTANLEDFEVINIEYIDTNTLVKVVRNNYRESSGSELYRVVKQVLPGVVKISSFPEYSVIKPGEYERTEQLEYTVNLRVVKHEFDPKERIVKLKPHRKFVSEESLDLNKLAWQYHCFSEERQDISCSIVWGEESLPRSTDDSRYLKFLGDAKGVSFYLTPG